MRAARLAAAMALLSAPLGLLARRRDTFPADASLAARVRSLGDPFEPVAHLFNDIDTSISGAVLTTLRCAPSRRS